MPVGANGDIFHINSRDELLSDADDPPTIAPHTRRCGLSAALGAAGGRRRASARRAGIGSSQRVQRLALPPDELHPAGDRRPRVPADHGDARRPRRRCSAFRCSSSGRTRTPATSRRPTTCRPTRRSTTTRSPTPTSRASTGRCRPAEQARFDPMITGFNPADMYARRSHPPRAARRSPACSRASASSRIHKEFVSSKISGETASLTNPALDRILDFAGRSRASS